MSEISKDYAAGQQSDPVKNQGEPIDVLVCADIVRRSQTGVKKYGTKLQALNGRDPLMDAYQEALDLAMYLRQEIEERRIYGAALGRYSAHSDQDVERLTNRIYEMGLSLSDVFHRIKILEAAVNQKKADRD